MSDPNISNHPPDESLGVEQLPQSELEAVPGSRANRGEEVDNPKTDRKSSAEAADRASNTQPEPFDPDQSDRSTQRFITTEDAPDELAL